jgi:conjugal transfer mating pair stabilization protein TraN
LAVAVTTSYTQAQLMYSCDGGVLQGQYCVSTSASPATVNYTCPDGAALEGTSCVAQTSIPATAYYTCASGELHGQSCVTLSPADGVPSCPPPQWSLTSPDIWTLSYDANHVAWCTHYAADHDDPVGSNSYRAATAYACPGGGTLSGDTCTTTTTATLNYRCDSGTLSGSSCVTDTTTPATTAYTCASGTLEGSQCVASTSTPATPRYSCPGGASPVGDQCVTYSTQVSWIDNCAPYEQSAGSRLGDPT